jgi:hypothetical protein
VNIRSDEDVTKNEQIAYIICTNEGGRFCLCDYLWINIDTDTDSEQRIEKMCHVTVSFFSKEEMKKGVSGLVMIPNKV